LSHITTQKLTFDHNPGIGQAIATILLQRPSTTVIGTSRQLSSSQVNAAPTRPDDHCSGGSKWIPVLLDESDPAISSATLATRLQADHGITSVDVVIANAGATAGLKDIMHTDVDRDLAHDFAVNAVGPAKLFRGVVGLLGLADCGAEEDSEEEEETRPRKESKFVLISTSLASIGGLGRESLPCTGYGMSKAAANWFARKLSVEFRERGLLVGIVHPG